MGYACRHESIIGGYGVISVNITLSPSTGPRRVGCRNNRGSERSDIGSAAISDMAMYVRVSHDMVADCARSDRVIRDCAFAG